MIRHSLTEIKPLRIVLQENRKTSFIAQNNLLSKNTSKIKFACIIFYPWMALYFQNVLKKSHKSVENDKFCYTKKKIFP